MVSDSWSGRLYWWAPDHIVSENTDPKDVGKALLTRTAWKKQNPPPPLIIKRLNNNNYYKTTDDNNDDDDDKKKS